MKGTLTPSGGVVHHCQSLDCDEVLDPDNKPSTEDEELFENKQVFTFSVFMRWVKLWLGNHVYNTDAQAVWKDFQEYMKSSLKGASEMRQLIQFVTNTVFNDNFKVTTEQFVLHLNEHSRQLDEISEASELFSPTVKLILLHSVVRSISDLRIVETQDEFQSTTQEHRKSTKNIERLPPSLQDLL